MGQCRAVQPLETCPNLVNARPNSRYFNWAGAASARGPYALAEGARTALGMRRSTASFCVPEGVLRHANAAQ
jgi:hypothetical protein